MRNNRTALLLAAALVAGPAHGLTLPSGFSDTLVATVSNPTALAFTPDGRLLITTQGGTIRVVSGGALLPTPALTIPGGSICSGFERGLLGIVPDPAFASNGFIYVYYTFPKNGNCSANVANGPVHRISRFVLPAGNVINPATEAVIVDNIPCVNGNHNGGDLHFASDGKLYASVGDGGCQITNASNCQNANANARRQDIPLGKILRFNADGTIPADNPWVGLAGSRRCTDPAGVPAGAGPCQETWAWGLRNPFRIAKKLDGSGFYVNDVGGGVWEEIDDLVVNADYGWNTREGTCVTGSSSNCPATPPGFTDPIYTYRHGITVPGTASSGCNSISGGVFVPPGAAWPAAYSGAYLFSDYVCGSIFRLTSTPSAADFGRRGVANESPTALTFGPSAAGQSLYYASFQSGGQIRRVDYTPANNPPTASYTATPQSGAAPLVVDFDASASSDPDAGTTLTYFWTFGDGGAETSTSTPTNQHTYAVGTWVASVRVRDQQGAFSNPVTRTISSGNTAPTPTITSPAAGFLFKVGETLTLTGSATDPQQGTLPPSALSWTVLLHHDTHTHPFYGPFTGNNLTFTAPAPEDLFAATNSYLEVQLTATDAQNAQTTTFRNVQPAKVNVTIQSVPPGLTLTVNQTPIVTPQTITSWDSYILNLDAPDQSFGGSPYKFSSWSDAGARSHAVVTPAAGGTYTATYVLAGRALYTLAPCRLVDTRDPVGTFGGPALAHGQARTFAFSGRCGIPATAVALVLNLTVSTSTASGAVKAYASNLGGPPSAAAHVFRTQVVRATNAMLGTGPNAGLTFYADLDGGTGSVDFIVDVAGYFE